MKVQSVILVGMLVELCLVPSSDAKRSFGLTRSRGNKDSKPSVRRNQHHALDESPMPPAHPKPSAPEMKKTPVPSHHSPPAGPPPAYPGMAHHSVPGQNAPPAYNPSYAHPPSYSPVGGYHGSPAGGYHSPGGYHNSGYNQPYGGMGGMGMGGMGMGGMGMGGGMGVMPMSAQPYRQSGFGSSMMTNLFAGLAGYQIAKAFSGGHHHRDREVIIIDNRQPATSDPAQPQPPAAQPTIKNPSVHYESYSTENPDAIHHQEHQQEEHQQPQVFGPANNEYNYYGIPQYGVPLYGYSLPAQITSQYQSQPSIFRPTEQPTEQLSSGK